MHLFLICTAVLNNSVLFVFLYGFLKPRKLWMPLIGFLFPPALACSLKIYPAIMSISSSDLAALLFVWICNLLVIFFCYCNSLRKKMKAAAFTVLLQITTWIFFFLGFKQHIILCIKQIEQVEDFHLTLPYLLLQLTLFFSFALVTCLAFIFYKIYKKQLPVQSAALFGLFVATQILLMTSLLIRVYRNIEFPTLCFCFASGVMCIVADFYVFKAFKEISQKSRLKQQAYFYQKQLDIQLRHYEQLSRYDTTLSHIRHDLKNEISVIQYLLQEHKYEDAEGLADEIQSMITRLEKIDCCENKILNALIFIYGQEMEEKGIAFSCKDLEIPEDLPTDIQALCESFSSAFEKCTQNKPVRVELSGRFSEGEFLLTSILDQDPFITRHLINLTRQEGASR